MRGILPEGNHLVALATRAGVPTNYYADLLERYGRDIAGAVSISVHAPDTRSWAVDLYDDAELVAELRQALDAPGFAVRDHSELSIAGLQNKLLVTALPGGGWGRPRHGHPSTHIMKLADGRHEGLLAAEHACMELARAAVLTTVATELLVFDDMEVLVVERYDREMDSDSATIRRIHQEDSCRALGANIEAHQGGGKYERFGGPTFAQIAALLDRHGDQAAAQAWLLRTAAFTFAIGNADAHGKNISLLINAETGFVVPAALYDTVPTALWPSLRATSAMSVNGTCEPTSLHDFVAEAHRWGCANC